MADHDLYEVTITITDAEGNTKTPEKKRKQVLSPMGAGSGDEVLHTARTIWREAGSPKHCHVQVELVGPTLGEFQVTNGEWEQTRGSKRRDDED